MTKVYGNHEQDKIYNIVALKNLKNNKVPAICVQIDRNEKKNPNNLTHGQEDHHTTTVLPLSTLTTCRNYPSGCTILECRLDDFNRPVVQILQVSGPDSNVNNQKMGICVEAKQMPTGPCSRVTSCPVEETCKRNNNNNRSFKPCTVETGKISNRNNNKNNNKNCNNESPVSKVYCCAGGNFEKNRDVSNNNQKACSRSNRIKLICVPTEEEEEDEGRLEIEERDRCEEEEQREEVECPNIIMGQTEILEDLLKSGKVLICRSMPPLCESINNTVNDTMEKLPLEYNTRRNGLDSTKSRSIYRPCPADRSTKKQENCISSMRCSKPMDKFHLDKPRNCTTKIDEYRRDIDIGPKLVECSSFRNKCSKEELFPLSCCSQDSFDCYKDYVSPNQFEKYRACRSKRNGLQDECVLPLPYNIKCKIKEQCYKNRMEQCYKNRMEQCQGLNKTVQEVPKNSQFPGNKKSQNNSSTNKKRRNLKRIKSRELFAGQVFVDCDCYHRNGLQHDCPRSVCGVEPCQELPLPKCDLGTYFIDKWTTYYDKLDRIMPSTFCGSEEDWLNEINKWKNNNSQANTIDDTKK